MKTKTIPQTNLFRAQLEKNILTKIKELRADGTTAMGLDNLVMVTATPSTSLQGAPLGTNARYFYKQMFVEVVEAHPAISKFILK